MTLHTFTKNLVATGYSKTEHPCQYSHFFRSGAKSLVVDNVRGRAYRLFLGLNRIPADYPATATIAEHQIDAESPWFNYSQKDKKGEALNRCWDWLLNVGFSLLADPFATELHRWTTDHKILIRDKGTIIPIPRVRKLP